VFFVEFIFILRKKMLDLHQIKKAENKKLETMKIHIKYILFFWIAVAMLAMPGCEKKDPKPDPENDPEVYKFIQTLYYHVYYWNKEVESYILKEPPTTGGLETYFESLKYDETKASNTDKNAGRYDRWGFMTSYLDFSGVLVEGIYKSYGFYMSRMYDSSIRVNLVYEGSPMDKAGIERGYELKTLNGVEVKTLSNAAINTEVAKETNRFIFIDREGNVLPEKSISATVININPILNKTIYHAGEKTIGYIMYNSFIFASETAITAALREMKDVDELIFDFRYNGGGSVAVAEAICEHLLPQSVGNDSIEFAKTVFSDLTKERLKWKDEIVKIKRRTEAMNLSRLFVITTNGTASASEEVINNMKPFLEVITVGAPTHGKPVGMGVWYYPNYSNEEINAGKKPDWAFAPITFRGDNSKGEGSFFSGIPVSHKVNDDLYHNFGVDPQTLKGEACLQSAIEYIQTNQFPMSISVKSIEVEAPVLFPLKGLQIHAGCL